MGALNGFGAILLTLVEAYGGTKQALATRIGISPSRFSRLLSAEAEPTIELCLNLAEATGTPPTVVLRAANFSGVAEQLERWFGPPVAQQPGYPLTPLEYQHLEQWRQLEPRERKAFTTIIEAKLEALSQGPVAPRRHQKLLTTRSA